MKSLLSVSSLLISTALLLVGHGMQLTLLPLRASHLGMPEWIIGLSASGYFLGFVVGCLTIPKIIARIGHIRCFSVLAAAMISVILCLEIIDIWQTWLIFRFITGVAVCGLYAVIESWLTSQSTSDSRGRVLAIYTFVTLTAMTVGQLLINIGPIESSTPFSVAAVFMALAIIPVGLTRRTAPAPAPDVQGGFKLLYQRSKSAFLGAMLSGLVMGSFWSLGAVFASRDGQTQLNVTWFMSVAIAGGALLQYPLGWLSDRFDRRKTLILLSGAASLTSVAVALSTNLSWHLAAVFMFGATAMPIYAIALATAADVCTSDEFVAMGTAVLLLHSIGAVVAPLALGQVMSSFGAVSLFWSFGVLFVLFAGLLYLVTRKPRDVTVEEQTPFTSVASDVAPTSFELDPRSVELEEEHAVSESKNIR